MAGIKNVTFAELRTIKFDVIEHFGISKHDRNKSRQLFVMNTVPPTKFGADCKAHTWYNILLKTDEDYNQAKCFLEELFEINCPELNKVNCIKEVDLLEKELKRNARVDYWGACYVTHLHYAEQFREVGV